MRKRVALLKRRADLTMDQFDDHWASAHAGLILSLPGVSGYVQNVVRDFWSVRCHPSGAIDGVVEVWFSDRGLNTPEDHTSGQQQADELEFLSSNTAFAVLNTQSYDAHSKVWVIAERDDAADMMPAGEPILRMSPDPNRPLM